MKYIYLTLCLVLLASLVQNQSTILDSGRDENMTEFVDVALYMIKRFIGPKTNTLMLMEKCVLICGDHEKYHTKLLVKFLNHLNDTLAVQMFFGQPQYRPLEYNLFIVDSWKSFESLQIKIPTTTHEQDFYFFILLTWSTEVFLARNLKQIFRICQRKSVTNVVVMTKSKVSNFIGFYSYQMFTSHECFSELAVREINRFEEGKLRYDFLFPQQLTNYYGCTVTVSARIFEPLLTFGGDKNNESHLIEMRRLGGIEGEVLKALAKSLNFKIRLRFSEQKSSINIYLNSTGCFRDLEQRTAHLAIGGLSSAINNGRKFTRAVAHYTTPYKFVVRSDILFGSIRQLINPLQKSTWFLLIAAMTIAVILIQGLALMKWTNIRRFIMGRSNESPTFNMISTFLGYSMPLRLLPRRNFARYILMLWLLFTLIIRSAYQGKMFDSLRLGQRKPTPKTIAELIAMDYVLLTSTYKSFYPYNKTVIWKNSSLLLQQLQSSEKLLTATVILDALAYYNINNRKTSFLTAIDETICSYQCVIYFRKNSILRQSFDHKLKLFTYSGLSEYLAKRNVPSYGIKGVKGTMKDHSQLVSVITFNNLRGLFSFFGILCQLSILTFILELLSKRLLALRKIMDWMH